MKTEIYYENIRLECVENGFILSFTEVINLKGRDNDRRYDYQQKIFTEEQAAEALAEMKSMHLNKMKEVDTTEKPIKV